MRWYLDTEFHERGHRYPIDLISIALVSEDGAEYYAVSNEFNVEAAYANTWLKENVLDKLPVAGQWKPREQIAREIEGLLLGSMPPPKPKALTPEVWAYFADYDWVALCQLFGKMIDLPKGMPMFCFDLKQLMVHLGITREELDAAVPPQSESEQHCALEDARWLRRAARYVLGEIGAHDEA